MVYKRNYHNGSLDRDFGDSEISYPYDSNYRVNYHHVISSKM